MTTIRGMADGPARRTLEPRSWPRPPGLALLGLALFGLIQAGCRSDGCSTCGIGNSISNGVQAVGDSLKSVGSIFHHKKGCGGGSDCGCGGGIEEGVVVEQGVPVVPGGMAVPAPGTIVPAPAIESEPTQLQPIPGPASANPTSGTNGGSGTTSKPSTTSSRSTPSNSGTTTGRSNYTTSLPRSGSVARKGAETDQSLSKSSNRPIDPDGTTDLFDSIAPVGLPNDVTKKAAASPPASTPGQSPAPVTSPTALTPGPAERPSAADGGTIVLPPIENIASAQAPGLRRYASVAPSISGGSAPSLEGLDYLKEKGIKTLVDLRKGSEVDPNFVDAVNDRGMVYISLPILANRLDSSRLARFDDLISRNENRPLFFCDTDGSRAALAWYIHQRVAGQEDSQSALTKAEELGLGPNDAKLAEDYLATQKPKARSAMAKVAMTPTPPASEPAPAPQAPPTSTDSTPPALPEAPDLPARPARSPVEPPQHDEATPEMLPGESRPQASKASGPVYRDPNAWKPIAALVLTGIGVPLAFWSRTMLSESRNARRRASLPGATPRSLDAPAGSDA